MNKAVKEKWVTALRSGEYEQGLNELKTKEGGYCCLGVLTDLYCKEKGLNMDEYMDTSKNHSLLTDAVQEWAGVNSSNPSLGLAMASHYNDTAGMDFNQIADLIEKNL